MNWAKGKQEYSTIFEDGAKLMMHGGHMQNTACISMKEFLVHH